MKEKLIEKAEKLATEAHRRQLRIDRTTPYIEHPKAVVNLLKKIGIKNQDILAAGWLHDTIEDCDLTKEFIEKEFNSNTARIVSALTRDVNKKNYNQRIINSDFSIKIIKLADTIHNCSELWASFVPEGTRLRKIQDCNEVYLELAKETYKPFYYMLKESLKPY